MSPIVIILIDEKSTDSRNIAYESFRKENLVIIQQQVTENKWAIVNHMAVPIIMFDYIQSFRYEKALLKGSQYTYDFVTNYIREFMNSLEFTFSWFSRRMCEKYYTTMT